MGFVEITIGKIKSPDVFYFVTVDEDHEVCNRQVREMKECENSVRICSISFHRNYILFLIYLISFDFKVS